MTTTYEGISSPELQTPDVLAASWSALLECSPKLRIRDAASTLGVSEAHLLATRVGHDVVRLEVESLSALFEAFGELGEVMASTRNAWAVIEKTGLYENIDIGPHVGLVLNTQIDLRLFPAHFYEVYAQTKVVDAAKGKVLRSIQCFDQRGDSLHKVYLEDETRVGAYEALVAKFKHPVQSRQFVSAQPPKRYETLPDAQVDVEAFKQAWRDLGDTHEFFGMLRKHKVAREQALRLAPDELAYPLDPKCFDRALKLASEEQVSIMIFVNSSGCIEIHTGPISRVVEMGPWINILDKGINLHVQRDGIARAWVVKKPTVDGVVTSLELFDASGELLLMLFGERKPGVPEDERWRALVASLGD